MAHRREPYRRLFSGGAHLTDGILADLLINHLGVTARFAPRLQLSASILAGVPGTLDPAAAAVFGVYEIEYGPWLIDHIDMHQIEGGTTGTTSCDIFHRTKTGVVTLLGQISQTHDGTDFTKASISTPEGFELIELDELYAQLTARSTGGSGVTIDVHLRPSIPSRIR